MLSTLLSWEDAAEIETDCCMVAGQEAGNRTQARTHEFLVRYWEDFFFTLGGSQALEQRTGDIMEFAALEILKILARQHAA